ncbi:hypothetical protein V5799_011745 [Amblyomma americanum]|uniref:Secreted protein n=1 Tax=Amblyomma americanum TaxID=6943 RepID=A0AAQ4EGF4_AMBAM
MRTAGTGCCALKGCFLASPLMVTVGQIKVTTPLIKESGAVGAMTCLHSCQSGVDIQICEWRNRWSGERPPHHKYTCAVKTTAVAFDIWILHVPSFATLADSLPASKQQQCTGVCSAFKGIVISVYVPCI